MATNVNSLGALGTGSPVYLKDAINPLTGTAYGTSGLAAVETRWPLVKKRWSIDTFNLSSIISFANGGTLTLNSGIGSVTYTFAPSNKSVTAASASGTAITYTASTTHNYVVGQTVTISGLTVPTAKTVSTATSNGTTITYTTSSSHGFTVGQSVTIAGLTNTAFNGTGTIATVPTTTTFTITKAVASATLTAQTGTATIYLPATTLNITGTISTVPTTTTFTITSSAAAVSLTSQNGTASGLIPNASTLAKNFCGAINTSGSTAINLCATVSGSNVTVYSKSATVTSVILGGTPTPSGSNPVASRTSLFGGSTIDMTNDTLDWVSLQQAIYQAESTNGMQAIELEPGASYVLSRGLELPIKVAGSFNRFTVFGNNATLQGVVTSTRIKLMYRDSPCQHHAENGLQSYLNEIEIRDLKFKFSTFTTINTNPTSQSVGLLLTGYKCKVANCIFTGGDVGLDLQFALQTVVENCTFQYQSVFGLACRNGQWQDAALANSQSNGTIMRDLRFLLLDRNNFTDPAQFAGAYIAGASDCVMENIILEGSAPARSNNTLIGNRCRWGIYFDSLQSTVVKDFSVRNVHIEKELQHYAIKIVGSPDQQSRISKICLIGTGGFNKIVEHGPGAAGVSRITCEDFPYAPSASSTFSTTAVFLRNVGAGGVWRLQDVRPAAPLPSTAASTVYTEANNWLNTSRTDIWDVSTTNEDVYDGIYTSGTYNTITTTSVVGVRPSSSRFSAVQLLP